MKRSVTEPPSKIVM